ncbi:TIGR03435 family protein [Granulicella sp. L56]|uniref:TIGR03435 family protein n=1 Tax=Granulicella sp. L56 TaxID=1747222 RepID=UPI0020B11237|nr:TIGR03435 family protein [Granulicella sp. L56]
MKTTQTNLSESEYQTMLRQIILVALIVSTSGILAQSPAQSPAPRPKFDAFEVATIKPVEPADKTPRYIKMEGSNRFVEKYYTLKLMIAAAYDLNPKTISGGPSWVDSDHYDILALTPGEVRPSHDEQMSMLRNLLTDRFKLTFHREQKEFSIFELEVAKSGPRLKKSTASPDDPAALISTVYPQRILLPARNATMGDFTSLLQRALLDRPVVDKTGLTGKYDFDLEWAPDNSQFGGDIAAASPDAPSPPFFTAVQQQLGLRLVATKGPVDALVVDKAERPTDN